MTARVVELHTGHPYNDGQPRLTVRFDDVDGLNEIRIREDLLPAGVWLDDELEVTFVRKTKPGE